MIIKNEYAAKEISIQKMYNMINDEPVKVGEMQFLKTREIIGWLPIIKEIEIIEKYCKQSLSISFTMGGNIILEDTGLEDMLIEFMEA